MKNLYKAALLAALGLASVSSVQAQYSGDLLIGFTKQSGTDYILDLGSFSSLYSGETWTLGTTLSGLSLSPSSSVYWGIVGENQNNTAWTTSLITPSRISNAATLNDIDTALSAISLNLSLASAGNSATPAAGDTYSWNNQTILAPQATDYLRAYAVSPNVSAGGIASGMNLYAVVDNNSAPTVVGSFSLNDAGTLTFSAQPVPEPSTFALLGGAGLLVLTFRNKFRRNQA